jgi:phospholipase/carboxylesterase
VSDGGIAGRAWFEIPVDRLDEAMREGTHIDMASFTPPGMKQVRENALAMLDALKIPFSQTVLVGFSQGAMLAADLALRAPEKPMALVILSSNIINGDVWREKAKTKAGLPFFQSHGTRDPLLGYQYAQDLEKLLKDSGLRGQLVTFEGGHEVPQEVIYKLNQFLKSVMTARERQ